MRHSALLLLLCLIAPASGQDRLDDPIAEHVQTTLVSEHAALVPGQQQFVGISLRMDPGWHVYWLNPGDSGLPLNVAVNASQGVEVGEVRFPAPKRYEHEGGELVDFVYDGEVTLLVPVTVSSTKPPSDVTLKVRVSWLVCKEACVPGSAERSITVPVRAEAGARTPHAGRFAKTRSRLPTPAPASLTARWEGTTLILSAPKASGLVAFPLLPEETPPEDMARGAAAKGEVLRLRYPARLEPGAPVKVLLEADYPTAGKKPMKGFHWVETRAPAKEQPRKEEDS